VKIISWDRKYPGLCGQEVPALHREAPVACAAFPSGPVVGRQAPAAEGGREGPGHLFPACGASPVPQSCAGLQGAAHLLCCTAGLRRPVGMKTMTDPVCASARGETQTWEALGVNMEW